MTSDPLAGEEHLLTDAERTAFEDDGYLVLPGVLDRSMLGALRAQAVEEDLRFRSQPGITKHHVLNLHDLVGRDDVWMELIDWSPTFSKVWGVLGWNIQLFHTQLLVTPPAPEGASPAPYGWHQDNNRMNLDLAANPQPRISLKVGYFLTDLPHGGMGNLAVLPGSHRRSRPPGDVSSPRVRSVTARAGDAIMFDRRLWHAASTNTSDVDRVFVTCGYAYRWLRPKSTMQGVDRDRLSPIRRQLLGAATGANGYFEPTEQDVPLRAWIRDRFGEARVVP